MSNKLSEEIQDRLNQYTKEDFSYILWKFQKDNLITEEDLAKALGIKVV